MCLLLERLSFCWVVVSRFDLIYSLNYIIFYFVMFGSYLLQACSFLVRDSKGMAAEGCGIREELGEVKER